VGLILPPVPTKPTSSTSNSAELNRRVVKQEHSRYRQYSHRSILLSSSGHMPPKKALACRMYPPRYCSGVDSSLTRMSAASRTLRPPRDDAPTLGAQYVVFDDPRIGNVSAIDAIPDALEVVLRSVDDMACKGRQVLPRRTLAFLWSAPSNALHGRRRGGSDTLAGLVGHSTGQVFLGHLPHRHTLRRPTANGDTKDLFTK
jgi:hypothetical protein